VDDEVDRGLDFIFNEFHDIQGLILSHLWVPLYGHVAPSSLMQPFSKPIYFHLLIN
jgi:hypothetical protein